MLQPVHAAPPYVEVHAAPPRQRSGKGHTIHLCAPEVMYLCDPEVAPGPKVPCLQEQADLAVAADVTVTASFGHFRQKVSPSLQAANLRGNEEVAVRGNEELVQV